MCSNCKIEQPLENYYKNSKSKSGYTSWCKTCQRQATQKRKEEYFKNLEQQTRSKCKVQGIPYNLNEVFLREIWTDCCPISGLKFSPGDKRKANGAQLDRKVPALGYTQGNVRFVSARMNRIKDNATLDELRRIIKYLEEDS